MSTVMSVGRPSVAPSAPPSLLETMSEPGSPGGPNGRTSGDSAAPSSAADHQTALSVFGKAVNESFRGKTFGPEDMSRFKDAIKESLNDPSLTQGQRNALQKIAAEFEASNDVVGSAFDSADWAKFFGNIGDLLQTVPGAEKIGDSLVNLGGLIGRSYDAKEGKFGEDDIGKLQLRSKAWENSDSSGAADLANHLIDGAKDGELNAASFGQLFTSSLLTQADDLKAQD